MEEGFEASLVPSMSEEQREPPPPATLSPPRLLPPKIPSRTSTPKSGKKTLPRRGGDYDDEDQALMRVHSLPHKSPEKITFIKTRSFGGGQKSPGFRPPTPPHQQQHDEPQGVDKGADHILKRTQSLPPKSPQQIKLLKARSFGGKSRSPTRRRHKQLLHQEEVDNDEDDLLVRVQSFPNKSAVEDMTLPRTRSFGMMRGRSRSTPPKQLVPKSIPKVPKPPLALEKTQSCSDYETELRRRQHQISTGALSISTPVTSFTTPKSARRSMSPSPLGNLRVSSPAASFTSTKSSPRRPLSPDNLSVASKMTSVASTKSAKRPISPITISVASPAASVASTTSTRRPMSPGNASVFSVAASRTSTKTPRRSISPCNVSVASPAASCASTKSARRRLPSPFRRRRRPSNEPEGVVPSSSSSGSTNASKEAEYSVVYFPNGPENSLLTQPSSQGPFSFQEESSIAENCNDAASSQEQAVLSKEAFPVIAIEATPASELSPTEEPASFEAPVPAEESYEQVAAAEGEGDHHTGNSARESFNPQPDIQVSNEDEESNAFVPITSVQEKLTPEKHAFSEEEESYAFVPITKENNIVPTLVCPSSMSLGAEPVVEWQLPISNVRREAVTDPLGDMSQQPRAPTQEKETPLSLGEEQVLQQKKDTQEKETSSSSLVQQKTDLPEKETAMLPSIDKTEPAPREEIDNTKQAVLLDLETQDKPATRGRNTSVAKVGTSKRQSTPPVAGLRRLAQNLRRSASLGPRLRSRSRSLKRSSSQGHPPKSPTRSLRFHGRSPKEDSHSRDRNLPSLETIPNADDPLVELGSNVPPTSRTSQKVEDPVVVLDATVSSKEHFPTSIHPVGVEKAAPHVTDWRSYSIPRQPQWARSTNVPYTLRSVRSDSGVDRSAVVYESTSTGTKQIKANLDPREEKSGTDMSEEEEETQLGIEVKLDLQPETHGADVQEEEERQPAIEANLDSKHVELSSTNVAEDECRTAGGTLKESKNSLSPFVALGQLVESTFDFDNPQSQDDKQIDLFLDCQSELCPCPVSDQGEERSNPLTPLFAFGELISRTFTPQARKASSMKDNSAVEATKQEIVEKNTKDIILLAGKPSSGENNRAAELEHEEKVEKLAWSTRLTEAREEALSKPQDSLKHEEKVEKLARNTRRVDTQAKRSSKPKDSRRSRKLNRWKFGRGVRHKPVAPITVLEAHFESNENKIWLAIDPSQFVETAGESTSKVWVSVAPSFSNIMNFPSPKKSPRKSPMRKIPERLPENRTKDSLANDDSATGDERTVDAESETSDFDPTSEIADMLSQASNDVHGIARMVSDELRHTFFASGLTPKSDIARTMKKGDHKVAVADDCGDRIEQCRSDTSAASADIRKEFVTTFAWDLLRTLGSKLDEHVESDSPRKRPGEVGTNSVGDALRKLRAEIRLDLSLDETIIEVLERRKDTIEFISLHRLRPAILRVTEEIVDHRPSLKRCLPEGANIADRVESALEGDVPTQCRNNTQTCNCGTCRSRRLLRIDPKELENEISKAITESMKLFKQKKEQENSLVKMSELFDHVDVLANQSITDEIPFTRSQTFPVETSGQMTVLEEEEEQKEEDVDDDEVDKLIKSIERKRAERKAMQQTQRPPRFPRKGQVSSNKGKGLLHRDTEEKRFTTRNHQKSTAESRQLNISRSLSGTGVHSTKSQTSKSTARTQKASNLAKDRKHTMRPPAVGRDVFAFEHYSSGSSDSDNNTRLTPIHSPLDTMFGLISFFMESQQKQNQASFNKLKPPPRALRRKEEAKEEPGGAYSLGVNSLLEELLDSKHSTYSTDSEDDLSELLSSTHDDTDFEDSDVDDDSSANFLTSPDGQDGESSTFEVFPETSINKYRLWREPSGNAKGWE